MPHLDYLVQFCYGDTVLKECGLQSLAQYQGLKDLPSEEARLTCISQAVHDMFQLILKSPEALEALKGTEEFFDAYDSQSAADPDIKVNIARSGMAYAVQLNLVAPDTPAS